MNLLSSLKYLVALHEHKHFGRAAQACHITQPALSNALDKLIGSLQRLPLNAGAGVGSDMGNPLPFHLPCPQPARL